MHRRFLCCTISNKISGSSNPFIVKTMTLLDLAPDFLADIQHIRRDIHAHPETSYEEHRTADLIAQKLTEWDIPFVRGLGKTGVVGIVIGTGGNSTRTVGLRADMDALPLQEANQFEHASKTPGKMHACGHDGHTAMLLGAARYLSENRNFDGKIVLIFQPAEEGNAGAKRMMRDGLFEQFPMDAVFGFHNWPGMKVGQFCLCHGPTMASSNVFTATIKGQGSHAAQPHTGIDPIVTATQIVQGWQTIISRNLNPNQSGVLSVTKIQAGTTFNIVPDEAELIGTVRTFQDEALDMIERRMEDIAVNTAKAYGAEVDFNFRRGYPTLINHERETNLIIDVLKSMVGPENIDAQMTPTMVAEDFAYFVREVPGCYIFIGNDGDEEHRDAGHADGVCKLHGPSYDFNDAALPYGISYLVRAAEAFLSQN